MLSYSFNILILLFAFQFWLTIGEFTKSEDHHREKRQAAITWKKWALNNVYYYFDTSLSSSIIVQVLNMSLFILGSHQKSLVNHVLNTIKEGTCLNFIYNETARDRIKVRNYEKHSEKVNLDNKQSIASIL